MTAALARLAALCGSMWLVLAVSGSGGWAKFGVGCFIATAGAIAIWRDLRRERLRR